MAGDVKSGKGYTAPKGRPTMRRSATVRGSRFSSTVQWVLVVVAFVVVLGAVFYFGRDFRSGGTGGGQGGPPIEAPVVADSTLVTS
jgi:hypothetical protein